MRSKRLNLGTVCMLLRPTLCQIGAEHTREPAKGRAFDPQLGAHDRRMPKAASSASRCAKSPHGGRRRRVDEGTTATRQPGDSLRPTKGNHVGVAVAGRYLRPLQTEAP